MTCRALDSPKALARQSCERLKTVGLVAFQSDLDGDIKHCPRDRESRTRTLHCNVFSDLPIYSSNYVMRRFWSLRLLVACLVVLSTSAPSLASTISWFCDGRLCGALLCCCEQPDLSKTDANCKKTEAKTDEAKLCAAGCGCTPVYSSAHSQTDTLKPAVASPPLPQFCLAPAPVVFAPVLYIPQVLVCLPDYRGPPVVVTSLPPSGLRAPPAS